MKKSLLFLLSVLLSASLVSCKGQKRNTFQNGSPSVPVVERPMSLDDVKTNAQMIKYMYGNRHVLKRDTIVEENYTTIKIWYTPMGFVKNAFVLIESNGDTTVYDGDWYGFIEDGEPVIVEECPYLGDFSEETGDDVGEYDESEAPVYLVVEEMPHFPGGVDSLLAFIHKNQQCPKEMTEKGLWGRVVVQFVVEKDGSLSNIEVIKPMSSSLRDYDSKFAEEVSRLVDEEAVRLVKAMPKWEPGRIHEERARVKYTLPIRFPCEPLPLVKK